MSKLEVFDCKQTSWEGLWWHPEYSSFSSAAINLSQLKKYKGSVRLYVRKNKFYKGGENGRPNYHFCFKDSKAAFAKEIEIEEIQRAESDGSLDMEVLTIDSAVDVAIRLLHDLEYGYSMDDLVVEADRFMTDEAISIRDLIN